jgi:Holliday junction resolvase
MRAAKIDNVQHEIVEGLEALGMSVWSTAGVGGGFPDLIVGWQGQNFLFEVKTGKGKLRPKQLEFMVRWRGNTFVVRNLEEAEGILGIHRHHTY